MYFFSFLTINFSNVYQNPMDQLITEAGHGNIFEIIFRMNSMVLYNFREIPAMKFVPAWG